MAYEGMLLSSADPSIRVMLIGTRVPPNLRLSLDHHGIAWKEITPADLVSFLNEKQDADLGNLFSEAAAPPLTGSSSRQPAGIQNSAVTVSPAGTELNLDGFQKMLANCENPAEVKFFRSAEEQEQSQGK